ncbi:cell surface protein [candidate division TA06 bacterium B3_TA06]|uniref:Cell surface protein n=1 Tax=candidate division TA06 bacterium B3_TA06 TaxID=2012487 RepID=A0A532V877_UNCT6|nr:MAG: cell surface protein [candidate division TA06 bacterium B3_TA06]
MGLLLVIGSISCQQDIRLKWKLKLGPRCTPPAIAKDGTIYVACENGGLYAVNSSGEIIWQDTIYSARFKNLAIGENSRLYAGTKDNSIYAVTHHRKFNPEDTSQVGLPFYDTKDRYSHPAYLALAKDGTVFMAIYWRLIALDTSYYDFEPRWVFNSPELGRFECPPAIGMDGTIYLGSTDGKLYALNPDSTLKWEFETDDNISSSPVIGANGTLYLGSSDSCFYAVNPDGSLKWKFKTGSFIFSAAAIGEDGTIYFGSEDRHIYALSEGGKLKWRYKTDIWDFSSPVVGADGVIYIGPGEGCSLLRLISNFRLRGKPFIYAINPDGTLKWKYRVRSNISDPTLGADGTLYFTCSKHLYALQTASPGLASSPWPKFGADNQNTGRVQ